LGKYYRICNINNCFIIIIKLNYRSIKMEEREKRIIKKALIKYEKDNYETKDKMWQKFINALIEKYN